jgi:hypothetical protein
MNEYTIEEILERLEIQLYLALKYNMLDVAKKTKRQIKKFNKINSLI